MPGRIDETRPFRPLNIAVLTVSDSRTLADDRSGDVLVERLEAAGHKLAARMIVRDERSAIADRFRTWIAVLPGSPSACRDAWDGILEDQLDIRHRPCNFAELLPRLQEGDASRGPL